MKKLIAAAVVGLGIGMLTGCAGYSEAHDYNAGPPVKNVTPQWERIETPYHYSTIIHTCLGVDGLYDTLANDSSVEVIPNDPMCLKAASK